MNTLYSDELLAHANQPTHATLPEQPTAKASMTNPLCGDRIEVGVCIVAGTIDTIGFSADACAVCVASASVMAQTLQGRPAGEFAALLERLDRISRGEAAPGSELGVFTVLVDYPSRKPCALLPWRALDRALHRPPPRPRPSAARPESPQRALSPWRTIETLRAAGERAVLATLVSIEGSSPCPLGSRMIVSEAGDFWGSLSGGCVESAVVRSALMLLDGDDPEASQLLNFTITSDPAGGVGLVCGGCIRVHIAIAPTAEEIKSYEIAQRDGQSVRVLPLPRGNARLLRRDDLRKRDDPLAKIALETLQRGPRLVEQDGESWFIEPLASPPRLLLVGATHIAQVLARLSTQLGFSPVILDPRPAMANARRFPDAHLVLEPAKDALPPLLDERAAVVVLSHDPTFDDPALRAALASDAFYVGALGSRKTHRHRLARLRESGLGEAALRRIRGPAGLSIGSKGASEIALSILAEIIATRRHALPETAQIGAVVLAAGSSRRAGATNKLLHGVDGAPMIRSVVETVLKAGATPCIVVLGHDAEPVRAALLDLPVSFVVNDAYAEGIGTSIARGVRTIAATDVDAALIVLGDMPRLRAEDLERLCAVHTPRTRNLIIAPIAGEGDGRRLGNPVLWPRRYFDELTALRGDRGAKRILLSASAAVLRVPIDHDGVLFDVDTIPS